jgi:hypothetical protein
VAAATVAAEGRGGESVTCSNKESASSEGNACVRIVSLVDPMDTGAAAGTARGEDSMLTEAPVPSSSARERARFDCVEAGEVGRAAAPFIGDGEIGCCCCCGWRAAGGLIGSAGLAMAWSVCGPVPGWCTSSRCCANRVGRRFSRRTEEEGEKEEEEGGRRQSGGCKRRRIVGHRWPRKSPRHRCCRRRRRPSRQQLACSPRVCAGG